jgi:diguanylate cyclase (GGDEF)-like protein
MDATDQTILQLNRDADALRAELLRLRRELAEVQGSLQGAQAAQLLEANEHLVLAALRAEAVADSAMSDLGELTRASQRDELTDTASRTLMLDRLTHAIAVARRHRTRLAVLFVDLDHFKHINDTLGHAVGDEVLRLTARRLKAAVRDADTVSRHGGDEFLVLLAEVTQAADAAVVAAKMLAALATPSKIGNQTLLLGASVGIALYPEDGEDALTLIAHADAAMYRSKGQGGGGYAFHQPTGGT